jgi:DNA-binding NarL/FixJ family response regulator
MLQMNSIVIHNNNIDSFLFEDDIPFDTTNHIDKYISEEIIPKLFKKDFDRIFIKDNLSSNYLELIGLRVAYHIRLSQEKEMEEKRFYPIIILSDLDSHTLNKLEPMAKILFTKNIFIISNTKNEIEKFKMKELENLSAEEYQEKFLDLINIEPPKDYTDEHSISNEWAIHQWSNILEVTSEAISTNHNKISSMLYYKYLKNLHMVNHEGCQQYEVIGSKRKGKILYIDDEWHKGWSDILNSLFFKSMGITFNTFKYIYKDKDIDAILEDINKSIKPDNLPDIVILDLRLIEKDHSLEQKIDSYSGIQIAKGIKRINPGIQIIMLTATSQSIILEKLYEYGILGYIKKEHPNNRSISAVENINKIVRLVDDGLKRKYLKEIFETKHDIFKILPEVLTDEDALIVEDNIFTQYQMSKEEYEPYNIQLRVEVKNVFDILDGNNDNKLKYAMVSIASSVEAILSIFVHEHRYAGNIFWDGEKCDSTTVNTKMQELFHSKFGHPKIDNRGYPKKDIDIRDMIIKRNDYLHSNKKVVVNSNEIKSWYKKLFKMIKIIQNPPNLKRYDASDIVSNLENA